MHTNDASFETVYQSHIASTLNGHGYQLAGSYSRPRGCNVEYAAEGRTLFVSSEGSVVHVELLIERDGVLCRVDLVQPVWYRSNRPQQIVNESVSQQLTRLTKALRLKCADLLEGDVISGGDRFCFPYQTSSQLDDYRSLLRGER